MPVIGNFEFAGKRENGLQRLVGKIETFALQTAAEIKLIPEDQRRSREAPQYELRARGVRIGGCWLKERPEDGSQYLSVQVADPTIPNTFNCALFGVYDEEVPEADIGNLVAATSYELVWNPPKAKE